MRAQICGPEKAGTHAGDGVNTFPLGQLSSSRPAAILSAICKWPGAGSRHLLSGSPPLPRSSDPAAALAWEPAPPRRPAAQRSAGGRRGPRAPSRRPAAGLPGHKPVGRRDGPQDGEGQHRPHVRQEPAGLGPRHPQPQGGRGEPGAPRGGPAWSPPRPRARPCSRGLLGLQPARVLSSRSRSGSGPACPGPGAPPTSSVPQPQLIPEGAKVLGPPLSGPRLGRSPRGSAAVNVTLWARPMGALPLDPPFPRAEGDAARLSLARVTPPRRLVRSLGSDSPTRACFRITD
ncbi:uncharacterized protein LOC116547040 [Sapajus apella]|uniref:Uncharacterized protein LOC116547040 n=1 Tax=Sapajus apella TaxID=9515 RepID=A0A6J3HG36_SAPAP|nr:uncharacterized protein LOC116547040 [Sapajus apella]